MAERAHPDDPAFQGTIYEQRLHERYARCQPFILNKDVLDVPCGTGWGTSLLSGYRSLTGVDNNAEAISYAQSHYPQIRFVIGPMEALPLDDHCYDVIVCLEGLEHIYRSHAEQFLHEAYRVLRADGLCVLTVPLRTNGRHSNNPYHLYEYEQQELEALLERFFILEQSSVTAGGDSNELFVVGRRRAQIAPASIAIPSQHFQHVNRQFQHLNQHFQQLSQHFNI